MAILPVFVGLDYHQSGIQVCIMDKEGVVLLNRHVNSEVDAVVRTVRRKGQPEAVAVEACCGASALADQLHKATGWPISLAHPGYVSRMKQNPDKTDFGDARLLADLLRVGYLPKVWLAPEEIRRLRRLVRYRQQLVNRRRNVKLRIRALLREHRLSCDLEVSAWTKAWLWWVKNIDNMHEEDRWLMDEHLDTLAQLNQKVAEADSRLEAWAKDDAVIRKLRTFHGIGLITAVTMRAEIGRFDRFHSGKQLARFCGLSPRNASSGERQADAGMIKAGNPQLRAVLIQLAQRVVHQSGGRWETLVHNLLKKGKKKNVVVAAVANRYMRWLYHQMQSEKLTL